METVGPVILLKRDIDACECEIFKSTLLNRTSPVTPSKPATLTQKFSCEIYEIFQIFFYTAPPTAASIVWKQKRPSTHF